MLQLMRRNIALNGLEEEGVEAEVLDWGTAYPAALPSPEEVDVVLAADCVYFEPAFPLLLQTLGGLLTGDRKVCYFCFKKRRRADWRFVKGLKRGFEVREIVEDEERERYRAEGIWLFEVRAKGRRSMGH